VVIETNAEGLSYLGDSQKLILFMEKDEAIELLNNFKNNLQEFKKLLISSKHPTMSKIASNHELIDELRGKLESPYQALQKIIFELGDKPSLMHGMPPSPCDAYEAALEDNNGVLFKSLPALELINKDLIKVRKKLLLVENASFKEHFGNKPFRQATKHKSLWGMFFDSFNFLFGFFKIPFQFLSNFILRRPITCTLLSAVILVLISFII
jgi:hypothetical protein